MIETKNEKSLLLNGIFASGYRLLNVIFPLISATYAARVLEADGIGKVAYAQNNVSYFVMFATLGLSYHGTRVIAQNRKDQKKVNSAFTELMFISSVATVVCSFVYCLFVFLFFSEHWLLYAVCGIELFLNIFNIDWLYQGYEEYAYISLRSAGIKLLSLCALFIFVRDAKDYTVYALIHSIGICGNYLLNVINARKFVHLSFGEMNIGRHLRPIGILLISSTAASIYSKVDISMLGWLSSDQAVGWYTNAYKVIGIVLTLVVAVSSVFYPRLSAVYESNKAQYRGYLSVGLKIVLLLAVPCCVGLVVVADNLINVLFGSSFAPASTTLRILAVFTIIKGVGDLLCYQAIISSGNEKKLIVARLIAGLVSVLGNALLIPIWDQNGAAVSAVISEIVVNGAILPISLKIACPDLKKPFCVSLLISALLTTIVASISQAILGDGVVSLIVTIIMGMVAYFIGIVITRNEMLDYALSVWRKQQR